MEERTHSKEIRAEEAGAPFPKCSPTTCHISPGLFVMVFFHGQPRCPTFACGVGHHFLQGGEVVIPRGSYPRGRRFESGPCYQRNGGVKCILTSVRHWRRLRPGLGLS